MARRRLESLPPVTTATPRRYVDKIERSRKYARKRLDAPMTVPTEKFCFACDMTKPASDFYRNAYARDWLTSRCKACTVAQRQRKLVSSGEMCPICGTGPFYSVAQHVKAHGVKASEIGVKGKFLGDQVVNEEHLAALAARHSPQRTIWIDDVEAEWAHAHRTMVKRLARKWGVTDDQAAKRVANLWQKYRELFDARRFATPIKSRGAGPAPI
jgi:hypothetical protein